MEDRNDAIIKIVRALKELGYSVDKWEIKMPSSLNVHATVEIELKISR